jgi:hypothetical protein
MPDNIPTNVTAERVSVSTADSFVVVTYWTFPDTPKMDGYDYEPHGTLNAALDACREYEDGEYPRARAVGIFAARNGMPIAGGQIEPALLLRLLRETRRAA